MRTADDSPVRDEKLAHMIAEKAAEAGGKAYYVGGYVRDKLLGRAANDIDVEIHGIEPERLKEILSRFGEVGEYGKSFGIYGLSGYDLDVALPRSEKKSGDRHRDFDVSVDPFIGTESAARRRDFTVNAIMKDVLTGEIIDHFGGVADIGKKILRHVDDGTFPDDALRVFRAARFSAQLGFDVAASTAEICAGVDLSKLSGERVEYELKKALMESEKPSRFFSFLRSVGGLSGWFPELEALCGVMQNPVYHPEGDAYVHTMLVVDAAAKRRDKAKNGFCFMLAALTHDFGKAVSSITVDGVIHAYGHEKTGLPLAEKFLRRVTNEKELIRYVLNAVGLHMRPNALARERASVKSTNRLFDESVDPEALIMLAACDGEGKNDTAKTAEYQKFLAERLEIYRETAALPSVTGADLINAGIPPGEVFSDALAYARKLHLSGVRKESALKETLRYIENKTKNGRP